MTDRLELRRVEISAFRRLDRPSEFELAPGPGITILVGPNGSGKSTVLDAIEWALTAGASRLPDVAASSSRPPNVYRTLGSDVDPTVVLSFVGEDKVTERLSSGEGEERVAALLRRSDQPWSEIRSVAAALRWTHFSSQRSTARLGYENGEAILKAFAAPAGLERLKGLDKRLWGRETQAAFKQLEREIADSIRRHETALARLAQLETDGLEDARAAVARELAEIVASLKNEPGLSLNDNPGDLTFVEMTLTMFRSKLEATQGEFRAIRSALRDGSLRIARLEVESDEAAQNLNTAENTAQRRFEARHLAELERTTQQIELDRLNSMRADLVAALSSRAELTEIKDQRSRMQRREHDFRIQSAAALETLKQLNELDTLTTQLRAAISLREVDQSLADLTEFGDPELLQTTLIVQISGLEKRRDELMKKRAEAQEVLTQEAERLQSLTAFVSAVASHLHETDTVCPVCTAVYAPGELADRARAAAVKPSLAAELVTRTVSETTQELGRVTGQLRLALSQAEEAREVAASISGQSAERQRLVALLGGVPHTVEAIEELQTRMLDLREQLSIDDDREARDLRAAIEEKKSWFEAEISELAASRIRLDAAVEEISRQPQGERSEDELRAELRAIEVQIDRANVQMNAATNEHGLATQLAEGAESSLKRLREIQRIAADALIDERMSMARATSTLDHMIAGQSETEFLLAVEEQYVRISRAIEQLASLRNNLSKLLQSESTDVLALLRVTYLPTEDSAGISDLRIAINSELERANNERKSLDALRSRLSRRAKERRDIDQRLQGTALRPWNNLFKAVYASLAGSLGETLEWTADRVDMRMREIESHVRPSVAGQAIPGWLAGHYFSEGQLAALQISAMITASVLLPWSRWPALLLDDPLQHADVIKVGAFADLLRSLCSDKNHQVIMTTHDRVQADFIAAKFSAGGLAAKIIPFERSLPAHQSHW